MIDKVTSDKVKALLKKGWNSETHDALVALGVNPRLVAPVWSTPVEDKPDDKPMSARAAEITRKFHEDRIKWEKQQDEAAKNTPLTT